MATHQPQPAVSLFAPLPIDAMQHRDVAPAPLGKLPALLRARLTELSVVRGAGGTSWLVEAMCQMQRQNELVAWVAPANNSLYPPDLAAAGVELTRLWVVHTPPGPSPAHSARQALRAAETLLRSGGIGLVIVDLQDDPPLPPSAAWQGRLFGLAREHDCAVVLLTAHAPDTPSLGPLIGLRLGTHIEQTLRGEVALHTDVLKCKGPVPSGPQPLRRRGPVGLVL